MQEAVLASAIRQSGLPSIGNPVIATPANLGYSFHQDMVFYNEELYWVGGYTGSAASTFQKFDGTAWTNMGGLPATRYGHTSVVVGDYLYVSHGQIGGSTSGTMWRFDLINKVWKTDLAVCPSPMRYGDGCAIGTKIYYFGGMINGSANETPATFYQMIYDTVTDTWTSFTGAGSLGSGLGRVGNGVTVRDNKVYIMGGRYNNVYKNDVWVYDPVANTYTPLANMPANLWTRRGVFMYRGWLITAMGLLSGSASTASLYKYDIDKNEWSLWVNAPGQARACGAFGIIGRTLYMFSGLNGSTGLSTAVKFTT